MTTEPTAENSAASIGPANSSNAPMTPLDPTEMAALEKFTDLLSRCRPRDDAEENDDYKDDLMT